MITINSPGGYGKLEYKPLLSGQYTEGANIKKIKNNSIDDEIEEQDLVVVKTHACGVNYADVCIRWGLYKSAKQYVGWPITPGFEFSGEVESKGENVSNVEIGQQVFGLSLFGAYSGRIRVPKHQIFPLPQNLDRYEAAGFLITAVTAWYAMFELARPRSGAWVLVHSAAGGVGSMLVQLAKIHGCHVVGIVGSTHKVDLAKQLGCDQVIDKSKESLWETAKSYAPKGFQVVFDANGVNTLQESYNHLAPAGKLIIYGFHTMLPKSSETSSGILGLWQWLKIVWNYLWTPKFNPLKMTTENKSIMAFNLSFLFNRRDILDESITQLLYWLKKDLLKVAKVTRYPLQQAAQAHYDLESGQTVGKLVLTTDDVYEDQAHAQSE